jgi:hypothetical protein
LGGVPPRAYEKFPAISVQSIMKSAPEVATGPMRIVPRRPIPVTGAKMARRPARRRRNGPRNAPAPRPRQANRISQRPNTDPLHRPPSFEPTFSNNGIAPPTGTIEQVPAACARQYRGSYRASGKGLSPPGCFVLRPCVRFLGAAGALVDDVMVPEARSSGARVPSAQCAAVWPLRP